MKTTRLSGREFNQDASGAKRAALAGPVYITDRGRPSHVLLTFESYKRLAANQIAMTELLSEPAGIEDVDFEVPASREMPEPPRFD